MAAEGTKRSAADLTEDDLAAVDLEGLVRAESLDLFIQWRALGGLQRGVSLTEITEAPGWLIQDFIYLLAEWGRAMERRKAREKREKDRDSSTGRPGNRRRRQ